MHPEGAPGDGTTRPGPDVTFHADVPTAGRYRLFLDFQHAGRVHTAAFTVDAGRTSERTLTTAATPAPAPAPGRSSSPSAGMTCASCANRIEKKLNKLDGVTATRQLRHREGQVALPAGARPRPT